MANSANAACPQVVYHSLETVLRVLQAEEHVKLPMVRDLLRVYARIAREETAAQWKHDYHHDHQQQANPRRHRLIVLEGLDGCGKSTCARRLAFLLQGELCITPPECVRHLRMYFDDDPRLRVTYYALGNYIAALQIANKLRQKPVVLDRFWHSTTAFALAEDLLDRAGDLPKAGDLVYTWPSDLLQPDLIFCLTVTEEVRIRRQQKRSLAITATEERLKDCPEFREMIGVIFKNFRDPKVEMVNGDAQVEKVVNTLRRRVEASDRVK